MLVVEVEVEVGVLELCHYMVVKVVVESSMDNRPLYQSTR